MGRFVNVPMIAGKFLQIHVVVCWACHESLWYEGNKRDLLKELKRMGWGFVHGVWVCPRHLDEVTEIGIEEDP